MIFRRWEVEQEHSNYQFDFNITMGDIRRFFEERTQGDVCLFEFGIDSCRFDLIKVNCRRQKIKGFEFKLTKADFLRDKKWPNYLNYCHTLSFVSPFGLIGHGDLRGDVGILYVLKWKQKHWEEWGVGAVWERKPRGGEVDRETYIKVISLLLSRAKWRKEEIF